MWKRGTKPMPFIARCNYFPDKEEIRRSSKNLKGSTIGISERFPKEINDKRKQLIPIMKEARRNGHQAEGASKFIV